MKRVFFPLILFSCFVLSTLAAADEGMWLYNAFPKDKVKAKYGFEPSQQWLDHVQLSSVRFNNGGSGSFVSADGLTFTNHHVGAVCVQQLSTHGHDYIKEGFYASTQANEAKCADLELNVLLSIEDVTRQVNAGVKAEMSTAEAGHAQRVAMSRIEKECAASTSLRCDVVTFYSGQVYNLYRYKKYTDVRLVFAPEFDIAFFGGDPDNFTYPRYDLDITFFRVYENGKPAHTGNFLRWSAEGVKDNELVFVSGNPGSTGRLRTMAQLEFLRGVDYPSRLETYKRRIALLQNFSAQSEENARIAKEQLFSYQNAFKAITGYLAGLNDKEVMARKLANEESLKAAHQADAKDNANGDPWDEVAAAVKLQRDIYLPSSYVEKTRGFNSELAYFARWIVRVTQEKTKPSDQRLREYRDSALPSLEQELFSTAPIYKSLETVTLADSLAQMRDALGANDPVVRKALNGRTPEGAAKELIANSKLDEVAVRKQLYEGGAAVVQASTDPLIRLMRAIDPDARTLRKEYDDKVDSVERRAGAAIARAHFAKTGYTQPPDATFTLRLSYGTVKGLEDDGKTIPYFTTMSGAFEHAAQHENQAPYQLPNSWMDAKSKLKLSTPLNYVSTADIIGGNSGSPTVNKNGDVVGIVFDGNIESLAWNFAYNDKVARAVHVDSRGIQEALRTIYGATTLADELTGGRSAARRAEAKKGATGGD
jgi:hypothetical protein